MDCRGRELQQVGRDTRFWWRVLEAPSPNTGPSTVSVLQHAKSDAALVAAGVRPTDDALRLEVPRGQRRRMKLPTEGRGVSGLMVMAVIAAVASATGALAISASPKTFGNVGQSVRNITQTAAVAAGFGIDQVSVTGQRYTLDSDVFDALDLPNIRTFSDLDASAALRRVERISWVDTAQITRVFPGKLEVEIRERNPAAIWQRGVRSYLIDATGRVLGSLGPTYTWQLPLFVGEGANTEFPNLMTALERYPSVKVRVSRAERVSERRWRVAFRKGGTLELAADRELEGIERVAGDQRLQQLLLNASVVIDARAPARITVKRLDAKTSDAGWNFGPSRDANAATDRQGSHG